jgi:hypothetical protein
MRYEINAPGGWNSSQVLDAIVQDLAAPQANSSVCLNDFRKRVTFENTSADALKVQLTARLPRDIHFKRQIPDFSITPADKAPLSEGNGAPPYVAVQIAEARLRYALGRWIIESNRLQEQEAAYGKQISTVAGTQSAQDEIKALTREKGLAWSRLQDARQDYETAAGHAGHHAKSDAELLERIAQGWPANQPASPQPAPTAQATKPKSPHSATQPAPAAASRPGAAKAASADNRNKQQ